MPQLFAKCADHYSKIKEYKWHQKKWTLTEIPHLLAVENNRDHENSPTRQEATNILDVLLSTASDAQLDQIADMLAHFHCRATGKNNSRQDKTYFKFLTQERENRLMRLAATQAKPSRQNHPQLEEIQIIIETAA